MALVTKSMSGQAQAYESGVGISAVVSNRKGSMKLTIFLTDEENGYAEADARIKIKIQGYGGIKDLRDFCQKIMDEHDVMRAADSN